LHTPPLRVHTHAAPAPPSSKPPPMTAVFPSADTATELPWCAPPTAPVPTSLGPRWLRTPPLRGPTPAAPPLPLSTPPPTPPPRPPLAQPGPRCSLPTPPHPRPPSPPSPPPASTPHPGASTPRPRPRPRCLNPRRRRRCSRPPTARRRFPAARRPRHRCPPA